MNPTGASTESLTSNPELENSLSQKQKFAPLPLLLYTYENFRRTYLGKSCEILPEEAMR